MNNLEENQKKYFMNPLFNSFVKYKGFVLGPGHEKLEDQIQNLEVREDDIWLVTFPKSGTTWAQEMIWLIMNNLDFEEAKKTLLTDRAPTLGISSLLNFDAAEKEGPEFKKNFQAMGRLEYLQTKMKNESSIVIKTHLPWRLLPKAIQEGTKKPKMVYVTRNPKDVCVSFFYYCQRFVGYSGDFETFCELFLGDKLYYSPYWSHVLSFYEQSSSNILFVTYEDMTKNLKEVIRKVAVFLEKPLNENQIEELAEHLSFENMKKNPAVNKSGDDLWMKQYRFVYNDFMRNGKTGSFKESMSPEMISKFDQWIAENTKGTVLSMN